MGAVNSFPLIFCNHTIVFPIFLSSKQARSFRSQSKILPAIKASSCMKQSRSPEEKQSNQVWAMVSTHDTALTIQKNTPQYNNSCWWEQLHLLFSHNPNSPQDSLTFAPFLWMIIALLPCHFHFPLVFFFFFFFLLKDLRKIWQTLLSLVMVGTHKHSPRQVCWRIISPTQSVQPDPDPTFI